MANYGRINAGLGALTGGADNLRFLQRESAMADQRYADQQKTWALEQKFDEDKFAEWQLAAKERGEAKKLTKEDFYKAHPKRFEAMMRGTLANNKELRDLLGPNGVGTFDWEDGRIVPRTTEGKEIYYAGGQRVDFTMQQAIDKADATTYGVGLANSRKTMDNIARAKVLAEKQGDMQQAAQLQQQIDEIVQVRNQIVERGRQEGFSDEVLALQEQRRLEDLEQDEAAERGETPERQTPSLGKLPGKLNTLLNPNNIVQDAASGFKAEMPEDPSVRDLMRSGNYTEEVQDSPEGKRNPRFSPAPGSRGIGGLGTPVIPHPSKEQVEDFMFGEADTPISKTVAAATAVPRNLAKGVGAAYDAVTEHAPGIISEIGAGIMGKSASKPKAEVKANVAKAAKEKRAITPNGEPAKQKAIPNDEIIKRTERLEQQLTQQVAQLRQNKQDPELMAIAASSYHNLMVASGMTPNQEIVANLLSGDDARGSALQAVQDQTQLIRARATEKAAIAKLKGDERVAADKNNTRLRERIQTTAKGFFTEQDGKNRRRLISQRFPYLNNPEALIGHIESKIASNFEMWQKRGIPTTRTEKGDAILDYVNLTDRHMDVLIHAALEGIEGHGEATPGTGGLFSDPVPQNNRGGNNGLGRGVYGNPNTPEEVVPRR